MYVLCIYVWMDVHNWIDRKLLRYFGRTINRMFLIPFSRSSFFPSKTFCQKLNSSSLCRLVTGCPCASESVKTLVFLGKSPYGLLLPTSCWILVLYFWKLMIFLFHVCVSIFLSWLVCICYFVSAWFFWGGWRGERG